MQFAGEFGFGNNANDERGGIESDNQEILNNIIKVLRLNKLKIM